MMPTAHVTSKCRAPLREAGFTLIELMIALVMTVLLIGGIMVVHLSGRATFIDATQMSRIQENVRFASDYMIRDIRNAGFRDETFLRTGHELQIRQNYADVLNGGSTLRIRYAGRGHCTEAFDEFRLVENEYGFDAQTGTLTCRGRTVPRDDPGEVLVTDQVFSDPVALFGGLSGIAFQKICPDGTATCDCDLVDNFDNACIGVRVGLQFQGMRELDGTGEFEDRSIELSAAFRNIVLDRMNAYAAAH